MFRAMYGKYTITLTTKNKRSIHYCTSLPNYPSSQMYKTMFIIALQSSAHQKTIRSFSRTHIHILCHTYSMKSYKPQGITHQEKLDGLLSQPYLNVWHGLDQLSIQTLTHHVETMLITPLPDNTEIKPQRWCRRDQQASSGSK